MREPWGDPKSPSGERISIESISEESCKTVEQDKCWFKTQET